MLRGAPELELRCLVIVFEAAEAGWHLDGLTAHLRNDCLCKHCKAMNALQTGAPPSNPTP